MTMKNPAKRRARVAAYVRPVARAMSAKIAMMLARMIVEPAPVMMAKRMMEMMPSDMLQICDKNSLKNFMIASATIVTLNPESATIWIVPVRIKALFNSSENFPLPPKSNPPMSVLSGGLKILLIETKKEFLILNKTFLIGLPPSPETSTDAYLIR